MALIIIGLYSFLWGKSKESNGSPISSAVVGEVSIVVAESVTMQSTAVVMPTASRSDNDYEGDGGDVDGSDIRYGTTSNVKDYMERGYFFPFTHSISSCCGGVWC